MQNYIEFIKRDFNTMSVFFYYLHTINNIFIFFCNFPKLLINQNFITIFSIMINVIKSSRKEPNLPYKVFRNQDLLTSLSEYAHKDTLFIQFFIQSLFQFIKAVSFLKHCTKRTTYFSSMSLLLTTSKSPPTLS